LDHFGSADKREGGQKNLHGSLENIVFSLLAVKTAWLLMLGS
jgi:hypothetical protein